MKTASTDNHPALRFAFAAVVTLTILASMLMIPTPSATASPYRWNGGHDATGWPGPSGGAFFAEGTTRNGFEEYLVLRNPCSGEAVVRITYMFPQPAREQTGELILAPRAGASIRVNDVVGPGQDVSIEIEADPGVIAERQVYFNYKGVWTGGHLTCGAPSPSDAWYFAEGTTHAGFQEWLCLQNPANGPVRADISYLLGTGERLEESIELGPRSRETVDVNSKVGTGQDVSVIVRSSGPIVAERPMYFDYKGSWRGGHTATGSNALADEWFFAEGTTRNGFEEWLCVMNPGPEAEATVRYLFENGEALERRYMLRASARTTIFVNGEVGPEKDVSLSVRTGSKVLCERAMYFLYHGALEGGHVIMGAAEGSKTWYFPSTVTQDGHESWLCVASPGFEANPVAVDVFGEGGARRTERFVMAPGSRATLSLNAASEGIGSPWVRVTGRHALLAERPTYFSYEPQVEPEPFTFAICNGVELKSPVRYDDLLGCVYHEAGTTGSDGGPSNAQVLQPVGVCLKDDNPARLHPAVSLQAGSDPAFFIESTRTRGSYSTTACDVMAKAGTTLYAPVTGTVLTAGPYSLYGKYPDLRVYILMDELPGYHAAVLHMDSLLVVQGQRVEAGRTPIGTVRDLVPYFSSGPNPYTREEGNHAHVQVNYRPDMHL